MDGIPIVTMSDVVRSRARTARLSALLVEALDPDSDWVAVVTVTRDAGVPKERLCQELSCSWSTYTRWMAGQTRPGPHGRAAIRTLLARMIREVEADILRDLATVG